MAWSKQEGKPLWQDWRGGNAPVDKIVNYVSADKTIAEALLNFYVFDTFGSPQPGLYATTNTGRQLALSLAFKRGASYTFVAYNPTAASMTVHKNASGANVGGASPSIAPNTLAKWQ